MLAKFISGHGPLGRIVLGMCVVLLPAGILALDANPASTSVVASVAGFEVKVYVYRPENCQEPDVLMVFHGLKRNAKSIRNKAIRVADKECLLVFAPKFDKERFPNWRYHRAGVVRSGEVQPREQWTAPVVAELLEFAKNYASSCCRKPIEKSNVTAASIKVYLFGHSAGGQFLSRLAAYSPFAVERIIIANPSVHVLPRLDEPAPYGFGGVFINARGERHLQNYLAQPITIYLGELDTGKKYLKMNRQAMQQGAHRLERGRNLYAEAQALAKQKQWVFNWVLVEVPGVGHSSKGMLRSEQMSAAMQPPSLQAPSMLPTGSYGLAPPF